MTRGLISVVLPVHNEADNIQACLRGLERALQGEDHEILVCYDFDADTTLPSIEAMPDRSPAVRLVRNEFGRGAANAVRAGFAAARGDVVVTTMADLCDPPERIAPLAEELRRSGAAVVSASRYMPGGSQSGGPVLKRAISQAASLALRWLAGIGTHDATNNFRAYRKDWLDRVEVETRQAFDIGLELTVKAHLQGEKVGEVPTSWEDRRFGESSFRVWGWMPKYLRWWLLALAEPLAVWLAWAALAACSWARGGFAEGHPGADRAASAALAAVALGWILWARSLRGRMRWWDGVLALAWLHPWHAVWVRAGSATLAAAFAASAAWLVVTCGWNRTRRSLAALARRVGWRGVPRLVVSVAVGGGFWLANASLSDLTPGTGLDPSWQRATTYFFEHGFRAGVDYVFTYGPLGAFEYGVFSPQLFWTEVIAWEFLLKGALAAAVACACWRMEGWTERIAFGACLLLVPFGIDDYAFVALAAVTVAWSRRERWSAPGTTLALVLLATLGLVKFSWLIVSALGALALALACAARRGWRHGAATLALGVLVLAAAWAGIGQDPRDFPRYLWASLDVTLAYDQAMSLPAPHDQAWIALSVLVLSAILRFAEWRLVERSLQTLILAGFLLATTFLAMKAAFVRHGGAPIFFHFAACAPFLLLPGSLSGREQRARAGRGARNGVRALRVACAALALWGLPNVRDDFPSGVEGMARFAREVAETNVRILRHLDGVRQVRTTQLGRVRGHNDMPRTRQEIGDRSVDLLQTDQALVILNGFRWHPRPVYQSYSAYTPALLALNAGHFAGARAPEYVLVDLGGGIDSRLPLMDDNEALGAILRRYRPLFVERGHLLMKRQDGGRSDGGGEVVLERTVRLGEEVDLASIPGRGLLLALDVRPSLLGRLLSCAYHSPWVWLEYQTQHGAWERRRIVPDMVRSGVLVRPQPLDALSLARLYAGEIEQRIERFRVFVPESRRAFVDPDVRVRVLRADDLLPPVEPGLEMEVLGTVFRPVPETVDVLENVSTSVIDGREALVLGAPNRVRFLVEPGRHVLRGRYGLVPEKDGLGDGVRFGVLRVDPSGEESLFEDLLEPRAGASSGALTISFETARRCRIVLETHPGAAGDSAHDWAYWSDVELTAGN